MQSNLEKPRSRVMASAASIEACIDARLGWRIAEWLALTNTSRTSLWRQAKAGQIKIIRVGGIPLIPRSEAVRLGLLPQNTA
jgi:hypothetical protein